MRAHLGGSSRQSLVTARASLDAAVKGVDANTASALSAELFFVADVLDKNIAVRRATTSPNTLIVYYGIFVTFTTLYFVGFLF